MYANLLSKLKQSRWLQLAFGILILGFLLNSLVTGWQRVQEAEWHFQPVPLLIAMACLILYMVSHGFLWTWMLRRLNFHVPYRDGIRTYLISQLAKYIPGGVWSFAALTSSSEQLGVPASLLNLTYILDLLLVAWVSAFAAVPILPIIFPDLPLPIDMIVLVCLAGSVIVMPFILRKALEIMAGWRHFSSEISIQSLTSYRTTLFLFLVYILVHAIQMFAFFLFIRSLVSISNSDAIFAMVAWSGAWCIGFIILIMPSGLGVREATLTLLLQHIMPASTATVLALGYRVFTTIEDLFLFFSVLAVSAVMRRRSTSPKPDLTVRRL